mmetsp:Transcript_79988/g.126203  ORF Transcript_79988/g.126203 Transcript_79988/m.126203 type:complete len:326 (-) Transcript_79988:124-1101(-)
MAKIAQPQRLGASASDPAISINKHNSSELSSTRPGNKARGGSSQTASTTALALYAAPSYSSLYVDPEDLEPGPGAYDQHDSIGYQHLSTRESSRMISLTAKHDRSWAKVMITKDHLNVLKARDTPGPGTYKPGLGPESQARVRFGTSKRPALCDTHFRAPGPEYETRGAPDNPPVSIRFSKANRFDRDGEALSTSLGSTGPGQYEVGSVFDGVRLAKSFGAGMRAYDKVRFPGSEKEMIGKNSPGPGPGTHFQNSGKSISFCRAERLPGDNNAKRQPGPGQYENHEKPYPHSRNQSCYSFGRPHARGRINWGKMRLLHNSTWGIH